MASRPSFREMALKREKTKAKKKAEPSAAAVAAETSERSVAPQPTPAGGSGEIAPVAASAPTALFHQPIDIDGESADTDRQPLLKRKRAIAEKGKGPETSKKKKHREVPILPEVPAIPADPRGSESPFPAVFYEDSAAAAALVAKVTCPGERFPIPGNLFNGEFFQEFATRQIKALAHCNRMVISYDQEIKSRQLFIDEAKAREEAEKKEVADRIAALTAELEATKRSSDDTFKHLQALTVEKKKCEERLVEQDKEMAAMKLSHKREIEDAMAVARRTESGEAQKRMNRGSALLKKMMGDPMTELLQYAQTCANLELLDIIEKAEASGKPHDLKVERGFVEEQRAALGRADDAFDEMADELKALLGKDQILSISLNDLVFSPPLEVVAKSVGITTASGSNDGSMGLRLKDAHEELGGEPGKSGSEKVEEPAPVEAQTDLARIDPVAERPSAEVASSSAPAGEAEKDKEDGEL